MRVIVAGSRYWLDAESIWIELTGRLLRTGHLMVVHGDCRDFRGRPRGADRFANEWAVDAQRQGFDVEIEPHPAKWKLFGNKAGPMRNREMVAMGVWCQKCQIEGMVLAWPLGGLGGTHNLMTAAEEAGIRVVNCADQVKRRLRD